MSSGCLRITSLVYALSTSARSGGTTICSAEYIGSTSSPMFPTARSPAESARAQRLLLDKTRLPLCVKTSHARARTSRPLRYAAEGNKSIPEKQRGRVSHSETAGVLRSLAANTQTLLEVVSSSTPFCLSLSPPVSSPSFDFAKAKNTLIENPRNHYFEHYILKCHILMKYFYKYRILGNRN